jgi:CRISPR type III-B/RAMP module RAMP protein Cmr1
MRRTLPQINAEQQLTYTATSISQDIRYKLITPLVGGGTESYKNDEHSVIRVSSIRGVLRFWWRATRGGLSHGDARHLRRLEARIWGGNCREYTAKATLSTTPVVANGQYHNGVFGRNDGFLVEWVGNGVIHVRYSHDDTHVFHDVTFDTKGEYNILLRNAQSVEIIRADFDDQSLSSLVVVFDGNQYQIICNQREVMHAAKVKMHVVSYIANNRIITETDPGSMLLSGAGNVSINDVRSVLSYVLFPLRNVQKARIRTGVEFTLHIEYPDVYREDVEAALWAWEHFGGLGARTRRGLGAIERLNNKNEPIVYAQPLHERLVNGLADYVVNGTWPKPTPHISLVTLDAYGGATGASIFFDNQPDQNDAHTVWGHLFQKYRDFRQHRFLRGDRPHGENIWPEPNSLRQMERAPLRNVPPFNAQGFQSHFPRAQMGMPIEHFFTSTKFNPTIRADVKHTVNIRDMHDQTKDARFASPVMFRPVRDGNSYKGIVVILGGSRAPSTAHINETTTIVTVYGNPGAHLLNRTGNPHGPTTTDDVLQGLFNFFTLP